MGLKWERKRIQKWRKDGKYVNKLKTKIRKKGKQ